MANLFVGGVFQAIGAAGLALPGARLYTYAAGTLTPLATYTDQGGGSANANPVVCDAAGQASVWLGSNAYRMILKTSGDVQIWDRDNISGPASAADLSNTSSTSLGDAMVGVKRTEAGASARTLHFYIQHSKLHVSNYCDPTSDTAAQVATALATAITDAKGGGKALEFETGATYTTNAETAFLGAANLRGLRFWGNGCTIYRNTGAGPVVSLDSSGDALRCDDIEFLDFVLKGQAAAT